MSRIADEHHHCLQDLVRFTAFRWAIQERIAPGSVVAEFFEQGIAPSLQTREEYVPLYSS